MKILIISGFLGAGKTTFIKAMTKATGRSFVIYENEYGNSGVDTKILEDENLSVWESTENCVCCTGKGDFTQSLITISSTLDPDYLIVEPTGVAKLRSIIQNINQTGYERISILSPVTIADCVNWKQQLKAAEDVWTDQIAGAGTIVLSKLGKESDNNELKEKIRTLNSEARIFEESFENFDSSFFFELLGKAESNNNSDKAVSDDSKSKLVQLTIENAHLYTIAHLAYILDLAVMGAFGKVSRAKGFLELQGEDGWVKFDLVEREWAITGMDSSDDRTKSVAIFIGEELQKPVLLELFKDDFVKKDFVKTLTKAPSVKNLW